MYSLLLLLSLFSSWYCLTLHSRREDRLALGVILNLLLGCLVECGTVTLILLRNPLLEGTVKLRLLQEVAEGLEDGVELRAWLPGVWLQEAKADVAEAVVCDVGVVDAGAELDDRGLERVVGWKADDDAELAWIVGRRVWCREGDVPGVDGAFVGKGDFKALGGTLGNFGEFLSVRIC